MRRRGPDLTTLHEALSLATLVALAVHGLSLLGDHFLSASLADIALPFAWSYKTIWTSIGIIGGWALVFLGLSYYARRTIGVKRWRKLHRLTALAWIAGVVHTLGEGTDAGQIWFLAMLEHRRCARHRAPAGPPPHRGSPASGAHARHRTPPAPRRGGPHEPAWAVSAGAAHTRRPPLTRGRRGAAPDGAASDAPPPLRGRPRPGEIEPAPTRSPPAGSKTPALRGKSSHDSRSPASWLENPRAQRDARAGGAAGEGSTAPAGGGPQSRRTRPRPGPSACRSRPARRCQTASRRPPSTRGRRWRRS